VLVTVLSDEAVGSDVVVQEVGQTLTSVAEELGVNISVINVQRLGRYSLYYYDYSAVMSSNVDLIIHQALEVSIVRT